MEAQMQCVFCQLCWLRVWCSTVDTFLCLMYAPSSLGEGRIGWSLDDDNEEGRSSARCCGPIGEGVPRLVRRF